MSDYRKPPKPKHYDTAQKGQCRYCGEDIIKANGSLNSKASWHRDCVAEYRVLYWPAETRKAVWKRDKGLCEHCGAKCGARGWDMDHRKPLIEAKGDLTYWKLNNCATLCHQCHKNKTGSEASARAEARAVQKKAMGTTGAKPKKKRTKSRIITK